MISIGEVKINEHFMYIEFDGRHKDEKTIGHLIIDDSKLYVQLDDNLGDYIDSLCLMFDTIQIAPDFDIIKDRRQLASKLKSKGYGALFVGPEMRNIRVHKHNLNDNDYSSVRASDYRNSIIFYSKVPLKDSNPTVGDDSVCVP
ncbi:MAG: hypothetical protein ACE5J7_00785 [Candidatus Aenigmatarchaeota archaeon]